LLLLRAHSQPSPDGSKPIVYSILELLFCVLVDSPVNARTFERLSGLEAVVRVLKGTGVAKEVRYVRFTHRLIRDGYLDDDNR